MTATFRVARVLLALAAVFAAGTGSVRAADPTPTPVPLIGGVLDAKEGHVTVTSRSTQTVSVSMGGEGPFTLEADHFTLDPGESRTLAVAGESNGTVEAHFAPIGEAEAGDSATVTLTVGVPQPAPWTPPWGAILAAAVGALVVLRGLVAVSRLRRRFRIVRVDP
ncbi:MAG TPA: hypothetical protein VNL94_06730 [Candidatus Binatia bacterium]|nr:hypothetical protein [Candidatus Binatia bacterium]